MRRTFGSVLVLLGKDFLRDHSHGLGQLNDKLALAAVVVGDADDQPGADLGDVAADIDRTVEVVDVREPAAIETVWKVRLTCSCGR